MSTFVLVYQGGIANVFRVNMYRFSPYDRHAERIYQGDFHTAQSIVKGCALAGATVRTACCNQSGDVSNAWWDENYDRAPFSDQLKIIHFG